MEKNSTTTKSDYIILMSIYTISIISSFFLLGK
jgi:hypothetical protein